MKCSPPQDSDCRCAAAPSGQGKIRGAARNGPRFVPGIFFRIIAQKTGRCFPICDQIRRFFSKRPASGSRSPALRACTGRRRSGLQKKCCISATSGRSPLYTGQNGKTANNNMERTLQMHTMKNFLAAFLCGAIAACLAACAGRSTAQAASASQTASGSSTQSETAESAADGGWQYNQGALALEQNADAEAAFEKATEGLVGYVYTPVALIGSQVVAGTNYCILCRAAPVAPDAESSYVLLYVYADLSGNAEITDTRDLAGGSDSDEPVVGGLEANQGEAALESSADAKAAFDKALEGLVGCDYEAVAYLGSQVVSGTNYVILCRTTPVVPNAESAFSLVTVYADLSGNASLTDVTDLVI
jgi:hypothetical protein